MKCSGKTPRHLPVLLLLLVTLAGGSLGLVVRDADRPLDRWRALNTSERVELSAHYSELLERDSGEREALRRRARQLQKLARRLYRTLQPELRDRIDRLPRQARRTVLRELLIEDAKQTGQRILASLPDDVRERVQAARPTDRVLFLNQYREQELARIDATLSGLQPALQLTEQQTQRLLRQAPELRRKRLLGLIQERMDETVQHFGPPPGISRPVWNHVLELPPEDFLSAVIRLRERHPEFRWLARPGSRRGSLPVGNRGRELERRRKLRMLRSSVRDTPEQRLELAHLPAEERERRLSKGRRERAMQVLRKQQILASERLDHLESVNDTRFFNELRNLVSGLPAREKAPEGAAESAATSVPDKE